MERIKQALEKARQQQASGAVVAAAVVAEEAIAPPAAMPEPVPAPRIQQDDSIAVNYVNTDVVELDPAHLERHRIVAFSKNIPNNWVFDILRTQVIQKMDANGWRTVGITSPTPEAGKTVVAINLAMSIAHQTHRTAMLVDFDLIRPQIGAYLGLRKDVSLNEVLAGKVELAQAMINPNLPRLVVLPTNHPEKKSSEILTSKKVGNLIADLRDRYQDRVVLFDLPPLLSSDHTMGVLPKIDCVLVVVGNGMSSQRELEDCMRLVPPGKLLGVVLNKADIPAKQYYY